MSTWLLVFLGLWAAVASVGWLLASIEGRAERERHALTRKLNDTRREDLRAAHADARRLRDRIERARRILKDEEQ